MHRREEWPCTKTARLLSYQHTMGLVFNPKSSGAYPPNVIIGLKLLDIPVEKLFFFVIQTYNTSLLYLLFSKPMFHPIYIRTERPLAHPRGPRNAQWRFYKLLGQLLFAMVIKAGLDMVRGRGRTTYIGLIIIWVVPFLMLLWYY